MSHQLILLFEMTQIQTPEYQIQTQECRNEKKKESYPSS